MKDVCPENTKLRKYESKYHGDVCLKLKGYDETHHDQVTERVHTTEPEHENKTGHENDLAEPKEGMRDENIIWPWVCPYSCVETHDSEEPFCEMPWPRLHYYNDTHHKHYPCRVNSGTCKPYKTQK